MENSYGISIKNKYELFLENDDPLEIIREQERKAAARKAEKSKKSSSDKDAKGSAKIKQNKTIASTNVMPTVAQEVKTEKIEAAPLAKTDEKQKRQKSGEDEPRLLKDRGNRQKPTKEEVPMQDDGEKLEIGTFETRGSGSGMKERRGARGRGGGFRNTSERPPKENFEGGTGQERRPRRGSNRGFRPSNYGTDRNGENQENGNPEISHFESRQHYNANGFGPEERREKQFNNEERRGFSGRRKEDDGRSFGGFRRSYEGRPPRRNFAPRPSQEGHVDANTSDDFKAINYDEPQEVGSFGHWGAENSGADESAEGSRGRVRGFGRRGRGRGRGGFVGRREFNRRGGSNEGGFGVKAVEKREGTGSHNWGTVMDDLEAQQSESITGAGASWADQAEAADNLENSGHIGSNFEDESGAASAPAEPIEPEVETMTLDEYKAAMEAKRLKMEFNIRKPNEGCSDDKWKKTYVLKKKEQSKGEDDDDEGEVVEDDRHGKAKNVLPIEITFSDSRRGSRGRAFTGRRGGRGGFAGERGGFAGRRGINSGMRGGEKKPLRERAPNVDDEQDFPSLVPTGAAQ